MSAEPMTNEQLAIYAEMGAVDDSFSCHAIIQLCSEVTRQREEIERLREMDKRRWDALREVAESLANSVRHPLLAVGLNDFIATGSATSTA